MNNSDGAGIAWVQDNVLHIQKGYFRWKPLWKKLKELESFPVMLHCRLATHGSVKAENCHPFLLSNRMAMAHNGMLDIKPLAPDMTDSETFGKLILEKFTPEEMKQERVHNLLSMAVSPGKIALLDRSGEFIFLNRHLGVEFDGIWFSNDSFSGWYDAPRLPPRYEGGGTLKSGPAHYDDWFDEMNDPFFAPENAPPGWDDYSFARERRIPV
jgi:hypothetical protein